MPPSPICDSCRRPEGRPAAASLRSHFCRYGNPPRRAPRGALRRSQLISGFGAEPHNLFSEQRSFKIHPTFTPQASPLITLNVQSSIQPMEYISHPQIHSESVEKCEYQISIAMKTLDANTIVILPTGPWQDRRRPARCRVLARRQERIHHWHSLCYPAAFLYRMNLLPHALISSRTGKTDLPNSVSRYSTLGGISG